MPMLPTYSLMKRRIASLPFCVLCLAAGFCVTGGCATEPPLPTYPWTDASVGLRTMVANIRAVHAVSADGAIILARHGIGSIHFDAAVVMRPPGFLRIRAWKFGQAVFDLTLTPDGLWLESPLDPSRRGQIMAAGAEAGPYARAWGLFFGEFFTGDDIKFEDHGGSRIFVRRNVVLAPGTPSAPMICEIDRATLTPRKYTLLDDGGHARFSLSLEQYREYPGGLVWPTRLIASGSIGKITLEMKDVELNGDLPPGAFKPPAKAEKQLTTQPATQPSPSTLSTTPREKAR